MGGHCYSHEHLPIVNDTLDCLNFFEFGQLPILLIAEALLGSRVQLGEQVGGGLVVGLGLGGPLLLLLLALLLQDVVVAPLDKLLVDGLEGRVEGELFLKAVGKGGKLGGRVVLDVVDGDEDVVGLQLEEGIGKGVCLFHSCY